MGWWMVACSRMVVTVGEAGGSSGDLLFPLLPPSFLWRRKGQGRQTSQSARACIALAGGQDLSVSPACDNCGRQGQQHVASLPCCLHTPLSPHMLFASLWGREGRGEALLLSGTCHVHLSFWEGGNALTWHGKKHGDWTLHCA